MARKPNYDFEKRRKENERRAKKEARREEKLRRKNDAAGPSEEGVAEEGSGENAGPDGGTLPE